MIKKKIDIVMTKKNVSWNIKYITLNLKFFILFFLSNSQQNIEKIKIKKIKKKKKLR